MAAKRKMDSKAFAQQKRTKRKWVTFLRMCRYGVNNFTRNAWLTVAATAVMTITLFVIFASVASRQVLVDTVSLLRDRVDMSVYVQNDITDEAVADIQRGLEGLETVTSVTYVSPEAAREAFIRDNADSPDTLEAVTEATNRFPGTFSIRLVDINNVEELRRFVESDPVVQENIDPAREPSLPVSVVRVSNQLAEQPILRNGLE